MYGTVGKFRVKPGRVPDVKALLEEWQRDFRPRIKGAIGGYTYQLDSDPNTLIGTAIFSDKDAYLANANNPEQDKWYQRVRECLESDPEWNDGEIIQSGTI